MTIYQGSEAVRITVNIKDQDEVAFTPDSVDSLKILAPDKTVLLNATSGWVNNGTGIYYYDYVLPDEYAFVIAEWAYTYGTIAQTKRKKIEVKYV